MHMIYGKGEYATTAPEDINLKVEQGDFWSIMGPSGSGKSTLLNILRCMDKVSSGDYIIKGKNTKNMTEKQLSKARNEVVSFVFQHFALLNDYTVYENIELPLNCKKYLKRRKKQELIIIWREKQLYW